ncbi:MAG: peptidylprolyl isomerase [Bryobacterales bacterium]|nr:peptidylprolyl isomerase [Bryobacterales bacterium]
MPYLVNGERIDESEIRREAALLRPEFQRAMAGLDAVEAERQLWEWARENVIEKALLRQEAARDTEEVTEDEILQAVQLLQSRTSMTPEAGESPSEAMKRDAEMQIRVERLLARVAANATRPDRKSVTDFYRKHREEFATPETIEAAHIVRHVKEDSEADAARQGIEEAARRLAAGEDFAVVADSLSDCPGSGGYLGRFARGYMVEEFDDVVFSLNTGEISPIFRTMFGFHIAQVIARHPSGIQPLSDVRARIEQMLFEEARHQEMERFLDRLKLQANIRKVALTE